MAATQAQRVRPAFAGWNTEAAPEYVPDAQAPLVENLLCRPGKLVMRGPLYQCADNEAFQFGGPFPQRHRGIITKGVEALRVYASGAEHLDFSTKVATATAIPSPMLNSYAQISGQVYGAYVGGTFFRWPGGAVVPTAYGAAVAPSGCIAVISHLERVFTAGGTITAVGGGVNTLIWSNPGGPTAGVVTEWQDTVSGLLNQIVVGADDGDTIIALGKVGRDLAIFKSRSTYILRGQTPSSFSLTRFSDEVGCLHPDSVVSYGDGVFFLSARGLMWFDGSTMALVSEQISTELVGAIYRATDNLTRVTASPKGTTSYTGSGTFTPYLNVTNLGNGVLLVTVGRWQETVGPSTTTIYSDFAGLYDIKQQTWSKFSSSVGSVTAGTQVAGRPVLYTGRDLFYGDAVPAPEAVLDTVVPAGIDTNGSGSYAIPAKWYSRVTRLASPINSAQLHRLLLDYKFQLASGADDSANGWYASIVAGNGNTLLAEFQVPAQGSSTSYLYRRRATKDVFTEAVDAQIRVEWKGSATALKTAEIHDVTIEFQATHQRSSA